MTKKTTLSNNNTPPHRWAPRLRQRRILRRGFICHRQASEKKATLLSLRFLESRIPRDSRSMATAAQAVFRVLQSQKSAVPPREPAAVPAQKLRAFDSSPDNLKIVLQPRLCTLRSYGPDRSGVIKTRRDGDDVSPFFATLSEYIESSKKSQDFEIISGRLAMIVFAATVTMEMVTGNSLFRKMDLQGIAEAGGVCVGAVACAGVFAWFSSARNRVGRIFTISCNTFIDSLIDHIIDGLFYESESNDWSDEI